MLNIITKYLGATNTKGSRIKATDSAGRSVTIGYPHELSGEAVHRAAANALLAKLSLTGTLQAASFNGRYVFFFTPAKD